MCKHTVCVCVPVIFTLSPLCRFLSRLQSVLRPCDPTYNNISFCVSLSSLFCLKCSQQKQFSSRRSNGKKPFWEMIECGDNRAQVNGRRRINGTADEGIHTVHSLGLGQHNVRVGGIQTGGVNLSPCWFHTSNDCFHSLNSIIFSGGSGSESSMAS